MVWYALLLLDSMLWLSSAAAARLSLCIDPLLGLSTTKRGYIGFDRDSCRSVGARAGTERIPFIYPAGVGSAAGSVRTCCEFRAHSQT